MYATHLHTSKIVEHSTGKMGNENWDWGWVGGTSPLLLLSGCESGLLQKGGETGKRGDDRFGRSRSRILMHHGHCKMFVKLCHDLGFHQEPGVCQAG